MTENNRVQAPESGISLEFPKLWPGYLLGGITLGSFFGLIALKANPNSSQPFTVATGVLSAGLIIGFISGLIYWFLSIHRLHKTLLKATNDKYPLSAGKAVGYQLIPFFNLYWMFKWTGEIAEFVNYLQGNKLMGRKRYGVILLLSSLLSRVITGISIIINFAVLGYLISQIKVAIADRALPIEDYQKEKYASRAPMICLWVFIGVAVVGLLAAIAIPNFTKARNEARAKAQTVNQAAGNTAAPVNP